MTTRLTLISNASTIAHRHAAFPDDEALDAHGISKASSAAASLRRPDRAWTSPSLRARQTADALGLTATIEPLICDSDYGRWVGRSFDDVEAEEPGALARWTTDPAATPHNGESIVDVIRRVSSWLDATRSMGGHVVAVTHAAVIRAAIVHAIGAEPASFWRIDVVPLFVADLRYGNQRWTLRSLGPAL